MEKVQFTKLKIDGICALLTRAQAEIERAQYAKKLMDEMSAPADVERLAHEVGAQLAFVFDRIEEAKSQLTISGK